MAEVLILGGTDITLAVAQAVLDAGLKVRAVVHIGATFTISYSADAVSNQRHVDVPGWCRSKGVEDVVFTSFADLAAWPGLDDCSVCLVAGWYHMVPPAFRERFARGCLGLHASLLPQLRGGAPLNWAILSGLEETGISLFELGGGVDDGGVYAQSRIPLHPRISIHELVAAANLAGAELVRDHIAAIAEGRIVATPQVGSPTYALQRSPEDGCIDWRQPAEMIDRLVRAVGRPYSGATTILDGRPVVIWAAEAAATPRVLGAPGQVIRLDDRPCVVTGQGLLVICEAAFEDGADALHALRRASNKRLGQ